MMNERLKIIAKDAGIEGHLLPTILDIHGPQLPSILEFQLN